MAKFVRWLGAFGYGQSLTESATWEQSQVERQVAAEPLYRGKSLLRHPKIGLEIPHPEATFARGWLGDAYTVDRNGILIAKRRRDLEFKNMDRFLAAWNRSNPQSHGEAAFNAPVYSAVIVKSTASKHGMNRAKRLSLKLGLPLKVLNDD